MKAGPDPRAISLVRRLLVARAGRGLALEIDAPEVWRGRQEFHAHTNPFTSALAQIDDTAFLFFLGFRVHQNQHFAIINFMAQVQQTPMSAYDQCFADLAKLPAIMTAAQGLQTHLVKHALAAALRALSEFYHALIMGSPPDMVNCPFGQVFPTLQAGLSLQTLYRARAGRKIKLAATASSSLLQFHSAAALFS